jgi:hypothetical protein
MREKDCDDLRNRVQILDKESKTLVERQKSLNDQADQKAMSIERVNMKLDSLDREIISLK